MTLEEKAHMVNGIQDIKAKLQGKVAKAWTKKVTDTLKPQVAINELKK